MAAQTADMADSLSDNADDLLRHAPPGYKFDEDLWPDIFKFGKHILDVACQGEPECEPKRDEMSTFLEKPAQAVGVEIEKLDATPLPAPLDAPPQGEGGTERPLARCPFPQRSQARGPSLYVGDSSFQCWFREETEKRIMVKRWEEGEPRYTQGCVMWPGRSLGCFREPERALIEELKRFPEHMRVMWMITPTLSGVNMGAIVKTHKNKLKQATWYDVAARELCRCMKKHLGHVHEGLPFMAPDLNGVWGPTLVSILYASHHWEQTSTGWVDPFHPSELGLDKYKELVWDALGREDVLSIKILDGWNFQEKNSRKKPCSFESYAREMRKLLGTNCVGHAIDVLETMVRHAKKCVPPGTKFRLREIAPPGPNLAAQRTTASGQGSGGMRGATGGKVDAGREVAVEAAFLEAKKITEAQTRLWKAQWSMFGPYCKLASPPQKEGMVIDAEQGLKHSSNPTQELDPREQNEGQQKLMYELICEAGRKRSARETSAAYRGRAQHSGTVSGQEDPPLPSAPDASLAGDGPRPVAGCSPVGNQELAQGRGQDSRTASGQVGPPHPLLAAAPFPPPCPPLSAALDASRADPLAAPPPAPPAPPEKNPPLQVKAKPRPPLCPPRPPPPPPPVVKRRRTQNWRWCIGPDLDEEEARKRETATIDFVFGAE